MPAVALVAYDYHGLLNALVAMKKLHLLRYLLEKARAFGSPSKFLLLASPLMLVVIIILIAAFAINQQLYDQQEAIIGRLAHAAVRHTAQLQREHLRLMGIIEGTRDVLDEATFQAQKDLVESRMNVMKITVLTSDPPQEVYVLYGDYVAGWLALQPLFEAWQHDPQDAALKTQILREMEAIELKANGILILVQASFEDHMSAWAEKSQFLNRLLTLGVFSFALIVLMILYTAYLHIRSQAATEEILFRSEQRLRSILDAIPDAVYRVNRYGFYTDYKPPVNESHCLPKDALNGKSIRDALTPDAALLVQEGIQSVLASGQQLLLEIALPDPQTQKMRQFETRLMPSGADEVQIIARDITTVREEEEAVLQAQKLESLGVLAGGIAHDFNNLLTGMLGQASLAVAKLDRGLSAIDNIQKVILSAERAADLTRQLLAYTGRGKFQIGPLSMNQVIRDTASLMETALPGHATLNLKLQDKLPLVQSDRAQIQQVLMNLFINAIEALPDGAGAISIITEARDIDQESFAGSATASNEVSSGALGVGPHVIIQVIDSGTGMDQATLNRIFDPFFSTKSKGHGLGLSATIGIIRSHQGMLRVQSQQGVGTTFTIILPALARMEMQPPDEVASIALPVATTGTSTVLVIDDEAQIRELADDVLAEQKYQVISASNGAEGIELFRANQQSIDVVLLDLKMPGMDGKQTFQELQKIQSDIKVIFTSGYSESEVSTLLRESNRRTFLPKPYVADSLTSQIAQMLSL